ncbi:hypothetical protein GCM10010992_15460 [Cloacibacterium rupense]|uniref:Lipoprotein n=2 Tax=Cloacibacterium rupense TaxID=517423 RepID=A0ABQ2NKT5_9FLAO|nr:hypothetical protein GCM10010992_15460 [Cloacibacterium rupense]
MKLLASIFLIVLFLFSCNKKEDISYAKIIDDLPSEKAVLDSKNVPDYLNEVVLKISKINGYENGVLAKGQIKSANFENFKELKSLASTKDLVLLTKNKNNVVALYAAIALLEAKYNDIDKVFLDFLKNRKSRVETQNGCVISKEIIAVPFYRNYFFSEKKEEKLLRKLDSLVLYNTSEEELLRYAFKNRLYPSHFKKQIEKLAFKSKNEDAILYLSNWHKGDYSLALQNEFKDLLKKDSLNYYLFETYIRELVRFNNISNNDFIKKTLKKDTVWKDNEIEMIWFLNRNNINIDND